VAVASTKAYTNQVITLLHIAKTLNPDADIHLEQIPSNIQKTIETCEAQTQELAKTLAPHNHVFFLGRGMQYPVAREMALKLKEITYIHAEGMMAGELKHGSIALIDPNAHTPVICLIPNHDAHMIGSTREVEARGAVTILVTNNGQGLVVPSTNGVDFALYATVVGQMLAYYTAVERGCDVDQPRNLAKSVTVH
jgi:glucosamine--fructose-6-phosphate aminotransferase (isomerizing)